MGEKIVMVSGREIKLSWDNQGFLEKLRLDLGLKE